MGKFSPFDSANRTDLDYLIGMLEHRKEYFEQIDCKLPTISRPRADLIKRILFPMSVELHHKGLDLFLNVALTEALIYVADWIAESQLPTTLTESKNSDIKDKVYIKKIENDLDWYLKAASKLGDIPGDVLAKQEIGIITTRLSNLINISHGKKYREFEFIAAATGLKMIENLFPIKSIKLAKVIFDLFLHDVSDSGFLVQRQGLTQKIRRKTEKRLEEKKP